MLKAYVPILGTSNSGRTLKQTKQCPKCFSKRIAGPHEMSTTYGNLLKLPGGRDIVMHAYICVDCGYIETYVDNDGIRLAKLYGRFTLNPRDPSVTHCPRCERALDTYALWCNKCGKFIGMADDDSDIFRTD